MTLTIIEAHAPWCGWKTTHWQSLRSLWKERVHLPEKLEVIENGSDTCFLSLMHLSSETWCVWWNQSAIMITKTMHLPSPKTSPLSPAPHHPHPHPHPHHHHHHLITITIIIIIIIIIICSQALPQPTPGLELHVNAVPFPPNLVSSKQSRPWSIMEETDLYDPIWALCCITDHKNPCTLLVPPQYLSGQQKSATLTSRCPAWQWFTRGLGVLPKVTTPEPLAVNCGSSKPPRNTTKRKRFAEDNSLHRLSISASVCFQCGEYYCDLLEHLSSFFFGCTGPYTLGLCLRPRQMPPRAYAEWKGCLPRS